MLGLGACGSCNEEASPRSTAGPGALAVKDDLGRRITLPRPARRIASLAPSNTETLFAVGCGDRVVLRDRLSSYPAAAGRLPATNPFHVSPEHVAGFSPDLVLLSHADASRVAALRRIGLQVAVFDPRNLDRVFANITAIGALCGARKRAERLVGRLRRRVRRVVTAVKGRPRPGVFIETDGTDPLKPWTAGRGSFVDELVTLAGGRNLANKLGRPYAQVNAEEVLRGDPELILVMGVDRASRRMMGGLRRLRARPGWRELEAVRRGRVIDDIHADLLSRPGPRLVDGLEALARALHPEARW